MTYGMKKKKKPERKNLTFGMAKTVGLIICKEERAIVMR